MGRTFKILSIFICVITALSIFSANRLGIGFLAYSEDLSNHGFFKPGSLDSGYFPNRITDDAMKKLQNSIIMCIGSPLAYVNGNKVWIDQSNHEIVPVIKNNMVLVPVRFIAENLGGDVSWDDETHTVNIVLDDITLKLKQGSDIIVSEKGDERHEFRLPLPVEATGGRTYVFMDRLLEIAGKKYIQKGDLIAVVDKDSTFNGFDDEEVLDILSSDIIRLPAVGSYEKLIELLDVSAVEYNPVYDRIWITSDKSMSAVESGSNELSRINNVKADATASEAETYYGQKVSEASGSAQEYGGYSTTNVQVQGVDEADVVKTDGEYIYQVNRQRIVIAKAYPADKMQVESIINFSGTNFSPVEMYVDSNRLVVIGNSYADRILPEVEPQPGLKKYVIRYFDNRTVKAVIYDITDKSNAKKLREVELEGYYVSSRKIGNHLYMIASKEIDYYYIMSHNYLTNKNATGTEGSGSVPYYRDTAEKDEYIPIDYKFIYYFPGVIHPSYMIIAGIDVENAQNKANISAYLGAGQNVYASTENMYITITGYGNTGVKVEVEEVNSDLGVEVKTRARAVTVTEENTYIYKFSLNNGEVIYRNKGSVPGRILNQFSMDEHGKYFRIATTSGDIWRNDEFTSKNNIYVLDSMLNIVGKVEDIAPGEQIYSVRFMGDRAYMVTFKTVDPLFVVDLKKPEEPKILGALKIPGYSDYLHPYDENHIIGFGKDTVEIKGQAYYLGMKIAMFDVSDVSNPVQKFSEIIGDRGTESEVLSNHRALLFSREKNLMAFPVKVMEIAGGGKGNNKFDSRDIPDYGQFSFQGAYVYEVDPVKGFTLKGRITHLTQEDYMKSGWDWYGSDKNIDRIIYIGDVLYTLSNSMIKANRLDDLKEINSLVIPAP